MLTLVGCAGGPVDSAIDAMVAKRLYCTQTETITYTYESGRPDVSDTLETIRQIRTANAVRDEICEVIIVENPRP